MSVTPGPSARSDDDQEPLAWWPTENTVMEAEWSRATLDVVRRVWRAEGASHYWRPGTLAKGLA